MASLYVLAAAMNDTDTGVLLVSLVGLVLLSALVLSHYRAATRRQQPTYRQVRITTETRAEVTRLETPHVRTTATHHPVDREPAARTAAVSGDAPRRPEEIEADLAALRARVSRRAPLRAVKVLPR